MKNSDRKFQLLSAVLITLFCCILLINSNYVSVESQNSPTFLTLTGSNFLDVENSERLQLKDFTLSTWFKTDKQDYLEPGTIVNKGGMNDDAPGKNLNFGIWITPEELLQGGFETQRGTNIFVTSKQKFNDGNWHNAILTNDGLFLKLYVDGIEIGKISTLGAIPEMEGLQSIRIGANSLNLDKFFTGDIDEVILWERALSLEEIFNFYNYDEIPSNGRILYLPFSSVSPIQSSYKYQPFKTFEQSDKEVIDKEELFRLTNFSLGTWFRLDRIDHNAPGILLNKGGFGGERPGENLNFGIWLNPSETIEGGFETKPGTNVFVSSKEKYNDGLWHYVLLTYDSKILKLYIDGDLADSKITSGAIPDTSGNQDFVIGGNSFMDDKFFKGDLDEIRVWNRTLGAEEVSEGFDKNIFNTNGEIFYEPYSNKDTTTPPSTETPDTTTPPSTETPDTTTPPSTETPDTTTPPSTETPDTTTPPSTETPDTTTPPSTETPDTTTPPSTETPDTTTPPSTETPDTTTPPSTETPDTTTPPSTETPDTTTPPSTETPDTTTPPSTETPDTTTPPSTETPDTTTPPSTETPDTTTPPSTETPDTTTPPSTETPDTTTPPSTETPDTTTPPSTETPDTTTPPSTETPDTTTPPSTETPDTTTPPSTETPDTTTPPSTETPDTTTPLSNDNETGFLLLKTNVINDNNGTKQANNFTIEMKGSQASPSSFKAVQSPLAQLIEIIRGDYKVQVDGILGYDVKFKNDCSGFTIENDITVCTITLNDLPITPPSQCPPGQSPAASQHLDQTTQICVPDQQPPPSKKATGFLLLRTDVINDNDGTKQASDFTINILGSQASPSSLKAAESPLAQVVAIEQGRYAVQIVGIEGYDAQFKNQCADFMIQNSTKVCTITLNDLSINPPPTPPPPSNGNVDAKFPSEIKKANQNEMVVLDGSSSIGSITDWTIVQTGGQPTVALENVPTKQFSKQFTMPNTNDTLKFTLTVRNDQTGKQDTSTITVSKTLATPPPTGDSFVPFNFAAAGDWGCNSNAEKNVQSILSKETELVLGLGDYSYESDADCWLDTISPINSKMKITIGNHDSEEEESTAITGQFLDHFKLSKQYYSFNKGNVFFVVMSTQDSYSKNSEQFNFVKQELEKASKDPKIDWIVVYYHKPIYTSATKHAALTSLRDIYHPLFDQYDVDLVLSGHNHNYQRTFPLSFNKDDSARPIIVNKNPNTYNQIGAPIFIISGAGGVGLHTLGTQAEFTAKQFGKFGHLNIDVSRDASNKLIGAFYDLAGNKLDEFTITKALVSSSPKISSSPTTSPSTQSLTATSAAPATTDNSEVDVFGIKKIYPTKPGGEEWFMNMDNIKGDPRFEIGGSADDVKKNSDASWSPVSGDKVRLLVYTSDSKGKFDEKNMPSYNLKDLAATGHWYNENDWKNIEMGGYFKLNSADVLGLGYSFYSRSIDHSSTHGGCGGATPKFNIGFDGEIKAKKEMWHISMLDSPGVNDEDLSPSIVGKWLGIKGIVYNLPGDKGVKQEFWIDKTNEGKWEKVYEFTDEGGFGERGNNGPEKCGGSWDQLYTWGSPKSVFTWDQSNVSFKFLSVREILPPTL